MACMEAQLAGVFKDDRPLASRSVCLGKTAFRKR